LFQRFVAGQMASPHVSALSLHIMIRRADYEGSANHEAASKLIGQGIF
jgi:hypothetical protein